MFCRESDSSNLHGNRFDKTATFRRLKSHSTHLPWTPPTKKSETCLALFIFCVESLQEVFTPQTNWTQKRTWKLHLKLEPPPYFCGEFQKLLFRWGVPPHFFPWFLVGWPLVLQHTMPNRHPRHSNVDGRHVCGSLGVGEIPKAAMA